MENELKHILNILWFNLTGFWEGDGDIPDDAELASYETPEQVQNAIQVLVDKEVVAELESLLHEPQMHGDWEQVIEDRLTQLKENQ